MYRKVKWQRKKLSQGLCTICGRKPLFSKYECKTCRIKKRLRGRKNKGHKAKTKNGKGRPTIEMLLTQKKT